MLEQAAQGGGGVTAPGGIQEMWRCGTKKHGSVRKYWWWVGGWLDWMVFKVISNLVDSMILSLTPTCSSTSLSQESSAPLCLCLCVTLLWARACHESGAESRWLRVGQLMLCVTGAGGQGYPNSTGV